MTAMQHDGNAPRPDGTAPRTAIAVKDAARAPGFPNKPSAPAVSPQAERRRAGRIMSERMHQFFGEMMDQGDAQDALVAELRREVGETKQKLAEAESRAARERARSEAESARLRGDVATLESENARLARDLSDERRRCDGLADRLRQVAAIAIDKTP